MISLSSKDLEDRFPQVEDEEHGSEMEEGDISEEESLIIRRQFHKSMEERTYGRRPRAAESALMTELIESQGGVEH